MNMSRSPPDRATALVLGAAALLFAASAYNLVLAAKHEPLDRSASEPGSASRTGDRQVKPAPKPSSQSAVSRMTYATRPDDCQPVTSGSSERPKLHAGALFKLIDIAAGVAARRHAARACVTISVDSVVLLKPIYLGDLIHVSASVNRAWGSSMEVGVRIVKESLDQDEPSGTSKSEYVSHSYLTFVAIEKPSPNSPRTNGTMLERTWQLLTGARPMVDKKVKPSLAPIQPTSRLESRRHLLAGRRRNKRLDDAKHGRTREGVSIEVKGKVRKEVQAMLREYDSKQLAPSASDSLDGLRKTDLLRTIEIEVLIQAWAQGEEIVSLRDGMVVVDMPGDEPLRFPEAEIRAKAKALGIKVPGDARFDPAEYRLHGSATPTWAQASASHSLPPLPPSDASSLATAAGWSPSPDVQQSNGLEEMHVADTLTTSMHIVFPQHTNSHGIIFGGNTMSWSEEVAIMACRTMRIGSSRAPSWKTVSMDGLEFNVQVGVGELMLFSALVVRTYAHSCEVYVLAQAEDRQGQRRFTNDVLFTMAYDSDGQESARSDHITTQISMPSDSALQAFAAASSARRQQRLELRQMLVRVYGS